MNTRSFGPLSDPRPGYRMLRTLTTCLALAVVLAVAEVLVRYALATERIVASQLALAAFSNVAVFGLISTAAIALGSLVRYVSRRTNTLRFTVMAHLDSALLGLVVAALIVATNLFGLGDRQPFILPVCAVLAGVATWFTASRGKKRETTTLSGFARGGVVAAWLACLVVATVSVARTHTHLEGWLRGGDDIQLPTAERLPNIVLVVVDTLRADRVGLYAGTGLTPHLDELANSAIVYTNAISTAPWTLPAHASLFTGLYPEMHGVNWGHYKLEDGPPTLAALLKERGYDTFAVSNNGLLSEVNGFARGFDSFIETTTDPFLARWRLALHCGAARLVTRCMGLAPGVRDDAGSAWTNWLLRKRFAGPASGDRPFFAFVNYFEPHDPYRPPEEYLTRFLTPDQREAYRRLPQRVDYLAAHACGIPGVFNAEQIALMSALYDAEVAYQDEVLGDLIQMLQDRGLLDNSWVVVTSDHGELFGERNMVYHTAGSHYKLLHIPLIVRPPGGAEGRCLDAPVQPVDIFATLLDVAGAATPPSVRRAYRLPTREEQPSGRALCVAQAHGASIAGLSFSQRMKLQADLSHWLTWVTSVYSHGYLLELDSQGPRGLFNLNHDPEMNENLADVLPEMVQFMLIRYREWNEEMISDGGVL